MKNTLIIFLAAIGIVSGIGLYNNPKREKEKPPTDIEKYGEADEESGRAKWELMRLADPKTGQIPYDIKNREAAFVATLPLADHNYIGSAKTSGAASWHQAGPINVGGRTRAVALDITNEKIILAGGATGGMWRSSDAGGSWSRTSDINQNPNITCLTQDTRAGHTQKWYYGTGEYYGGHIVNGNGICKSTDGGKTWKPLLNDDKPQSTSNNDYIWNIAINPTNKSQDEIYVAAYNRIYRSINGGDSFKVVLGDKNGFNISPATDVAVSAKGIVYATMSSSGAQKGLWRSPDGVTWTNITPQNFAPNTQRIVIGISPSDENVVYFLASSPGGGKKGLDYRKTPDWNSLWKYQYLKGDGKDSNGIWTDLSQNLPMYGQDSGFPFGDFISQQGYDLVVKVKPDDPNTVFIGGTCLFRSTDGFTTKNNIQWIGGYNTAKKVTDYYTFKNHHPDQHYIVFLPSDSKKMYSANDGGLFLTNDNLEDSVEWKSLSHGYYTTQFYSIALNPDPRHSHSHSDIIMGGLQDWSTWLTQKSDPADADWEFWSRGDGGHCAVIDDDTATFMYTTLQQGRVIKNVFDKNGNYKGWVRIDPVGGANYIFISPFILDPNNSNTMYHVAGDYIWRNDSLGQIPFTGTNDSIKMGWTKLTNTSTSAYITALAAAKGNTTRLYYGTNYGKIFRIDSAQKGNPVPKECKFIIANQGFYTNCIAIDPEDVNKVAVVFSNYNAKSIIYSEDGGLNWKDVSGNLEEFPTGLGAGPSCRWLKIIKTAGGEKFYLLGTSSGLFVTKSLNGTSTIWMREGTDNIGTVTVEMIDARPKDNIVVIGTYGNGCFSAALDAVAGFKDYKNVSPQLTLAAYPNPFSEILNINFTAEKQSKINLSLYDSRGSNIANIFRGYATGFSQTVKYKPPLIPSGIYFCKLTSGGHERVIKILKE